MTGDRSRAASGSPSRSSGTHAERLAREPQHLVHLGGNAVHRFTPRLRRPAWLTLDVAFAPDGLVEAQVELRFRDGRATYSRPTVVARNEFRMELRADPSLEELVLWVEGSGNVHEPVRCSLTAASTARKLLSLAGLAARRLIADPRRFVGSCLWYVERLTASNAVSLPSRLPAVSEAEAYARWRALFDDRPQADRAVFSAQVQALAARPIISVLLAPEVDRDVEQALSDMALQLYPSWELVVVAPPGAVRAPAERVKTVTSTAPTRAARLNAALQVAAGEIVLPLPAGARLREHALLQAALAFAARPGTTLLYADEDVLTRDGQRTSPRFKSAWSPRLAACHDYLGDPVFFARDVLRRAGGWREGLGSAADHDVKLRVADAVPPGTIVHLAKVLLHRPEPAEAGGDGSRHRAVADHLARRGIPATVVTDPRSPHPRVLRALDEAPVVTIIVPTRDRAAVLRICARSLLDRTRYPAFEIIIVDNGSQEPETFELFRELSRDQRVRVLSAPGPFNYSALNNAAVKEARGSILALVNNDIEVLAEDWLAEMVGEVLEPDVGCVGAKLYYPDRTLQHGGIVTGLLGGAGHSDKRTPQGASGYLDRLVTAREVSAVTGACLVVRRDLYESMGGLDEDAFSIAFNDVDFCLRVASAGYRNVWTPFAELVHHESVSRGDDLRDREKARRFAAELAALQARWGVRLLGDPYHSPHLDRDFETARPRVS